MKFHLLIATTLCASVVSAFPHPAQRHPDVVDVEERKSSPNIAPIIELLLARKLQGFCREFLHKPNYDATSVKTVSSFATLPRTLTLSDFPTDTLASGTTTTVTPTTAVTTVAVTPSTETDIVPATASSTAIAIATVIDTTTITGATVTDTLSTTVTTTADVTYSTVVTTVTPTSTVNGAIFGKRQVDIVRRAPQPSSTPYTIGQGELDFLEDIAASIISQCCSSIVTSTTLLTTTTVSGTVTLTRSVTTTSIFADIIPAATATEVSVEGTSTATSSVTTTTSTTATSTLITTSTITTTPTDTSTATALASRTQTHTSTTTSTLLVHATDTAPITYDCVSQNNISTVTGIPAGYALFDYSEEASDAAQCCISCYTNGANFPCSAWLSEPGSFSCALFINYEQTAYPEEDAECEYGHVSITFEYGGNYIGGYGPCAAGSLT